MEPEARRGLTRLVVPAALGVAVLWAVGPLIWTVLTSVKQPVDVFSLKVIPFLQFQPTLMHWQEELTSRGPELRGAMGTSTLVAVLSSLLALALATPAAYAVARLSNDRQKRFWWLWLISQRFLPPVVLLAPYFLMFKTLGLLDTPLALILVHAAMNAPFAALILQDLFADLPAELEEAARVDGASTWVAFHRVVLPVALPGLAAAAVLCMAFSWNEFLFALTLSYHHAVTMPVLIAGTEHTQGIQFWYVATRSLLALGPPAVLALVAQRWLVRGLTLGAVKG